MMTSPTIDFRRATPFWAVRREATLNWLALGLLLAAWNAADNCASPAGLRKPESLRPYAYVSVRAVQRAQVQPQR